MTLENKIALEFSRVLREWLTPEEMADVVATNKRDNPGDSICASHNYCDANMAMELAFHNLDLKTCFDVSDEGEETPEYIEANRLWNEAWSIAKASGFTVTEV